MNKKLQESARQELKIGLAKLPESSKLMFKRMYGHEDLDMDINDVVDIMPDDRLDWAMQQVQRSIDINNKTSTEGK